MSYQEAAVFAQSWGLVLLVTFFLSAVLYALWPRNRDKFERGGTSAASKRRGRFVSPNAYCESP